MAIINNGGNEIDFKAAYEEAYSGEQSKSNLSRALIRMFELIAFSTHGEDALLNVTEDFKKLTRIHLDHWNRTNDVNRDNKIKESLTKFNEAVDYSIANMEHKKVITKEEFHKACETGISETIQKVAEKHLSPEQIEELNSPTITLIKYPFTFDPKYGLPFEEFIKIIDPDNNISKEDFNKEIDLYNVNNAIVNKYIKENLNLERIIGSAKDNSATAVMSDKAIEETTITSYTTDVTSMVSGKPISNVKCLVPTNEFRYLKPQYDLSAFGGPNETKLQQKFFDKFTGYHEWRDIPVVSAGSQADY